MKVVRLKKWQLAALAFLLCLCACLFVNLAGYWMDCASISVLPALRQAEDFEMRSRLLMEALREVGDCDPMEAAETWAGGLVRRSAALQYAAMDDGLKARYEKQLETASPNWVTGLSSPWVEGWRVLRTDSPDEDTRVVELLFSAATSTGPAGEYAATLELSRRGNFWRITKISQDEGLYPYTLFRP